MATTVEDIASQITSYESRIAVLSALSLHVDTYYVSSPNAAAEMQFRRADHALVPQEHIAEAQGALAQLIADTQTEINKLKGMTIAEPKVEPPKEEAPAKKPAAKGKKSETPSPGSD